MSTDSNLPRTYLNDKGWSFDHPKYASAKCKCMYNIAWYMYIYNIYWKAVCFELMFIDLSYICSMFTSLCYTTCFPCSIQFDKIWPTKNILKSRIINYFATHPVIHLISREILGFWHSLDVSHVKEHWSYWQLLWCMWCMSAISVAFARDRYRNGVRFGQYLYVNQFVFNWKY